MIFELTREMAVNKAQFDLRLLCWRNVARAKGLRRDAQGKFSTERNEA